MFDSVFHTEYDKKANQPEKSYIAELKQFEGEKLYLKMFSLGRVSVYHSRQT